MFIKPYNPGNYGIILCDGNWMKCLDGKDWYSDLRIAQDLIEDIKTHNDYIDMLNKERMITLEKYG